MTASTFHVQAIFNQFPFLADTFPEREQIGSACVSRVHAKLMDKTAGFTIATEGYVDQTPVRVFFFDRFGKFVGRVGYKRIIRFRFFYWAIYREEHFIESVGAALLRYDALTPIYYIVESDWQNGRSLTVYKPPHAMSVREFLVQGVRDAEGVVRDSVAKIDD